MSTVDENAWFYGLRPEWLEEDERAAFAANHPDIVARNADCWQDYPECLPVSQEQATEVA